MMAMKTKSLLLTFAVALSGCTGGSDQVSSMTTQFTELSSIVLSQRKQAELPEVNRALLDSLSLASLEITVENRDALAYLIPAGRRNDPFHGPLTIWRTGDNAQVAISSGVIVATKGLGDDLQGSDMRGTVQAVRGRDARNRNGALTVVTSAEGAKTIALNCVSQRPERKTIEIVELTYQVDHLRERCVIDRDQTVVNEYWVGVRDRIVWQSRQWVGPGIGYVRTRFLKKL
jgi:group 4 capsule polysaccharide lipoprotein GfcB/YjbF